MRMLLLTQSHSLRSRQCWGCTYLYSDQVIGSSRDDPPVCIRSLNIVVTLTLRKAQTGLRYRQVLRAACCRCVELNYWECILHQLRYRTICFRQSHAHCFLLTWSVMNLHPNLHSAQQLTFNMPNQTARVGNNGNALSTRNAKKRLNQLFERKSDPHLLAY